MALVADLFDIHQHQQLSQVFPLAAAEPNTNGLDITAQNVQAALQGVRRTSQKSTNGQTDGSHSPVSRTATPSYNHHSLPPFHGIDDAQYQANTLAPFNATSLQPGAPTSPSNGERHLEFPQTHEQLIAANASLKTRVSELEVINDLFRNRVTQLEQEEENARGGQELSRAAERQLQSQLEAATLSEAQLRNQLDDSHRRENNLKRRLDELELELKEAKDLADLASGRPAKRARTTNGESSDTSSVPSAA
jgi:GATA-binding protein, other eukaryote